MTVTEAIPAVRAGSPSPRRRRRRALWALAGVLSLALLVPLGTASYIALTARADDRSTTDAIVVLGAAQFNGTPSPVLAARLSHALALYQAGVAPRLITVGGNQPGDRTTEADTGRRWLSREGVQASHVSAIPAGSDTLQSMRAVARLMAEHGWTSATIVTDPLHETRALAMARALGIDAHASPTDSGAGSAITPDYVVRETGGVLAFWLWQRWTL